MQSAAGRALPRPGQSPPSASDPDTQALIERHLASGRFRDIDELIDKALAALGPPELKATNLFELFEPIRGLLTDEEIDTLFAPRPVRQPPGGLVMRRNAVLIYCEQLRTMVDCMAEETEPRKP